ncbi:uncharacterized protein BYT42DRAFT_576162 [Radiomyces spectabilis]|uniref:uncharacterized protein n=1 Tax=Radiomyces spectabilis TaxID=64574 RepID=UPI002220C267|nr:uncharacterized protein BYT42DRAFT_576162 [Radiomyces spectabilis]KAI8374381.1 hypothetical protein BYT42DRAFT_576162 [Radiomyces spectabilis]
MQVFLFCDRCRNVMIPHEERDDLQLYYVCRYCQYQQKVPSGCIYHHDIIKPSTDLTVPLLDWHHDLTLPRRTIACPRCGFTTAFCFEAATIGLKSKTMKACHQCANGACNFRW